jgi:hypothetical protein
MFQDKLFRTKLFRTRYSRTKKFSKTFLDKLYSQRQQTPNPDAQDPALVPPVKSKTKKIIENLLHLGLLLYYILKVNYFTFG